MGRERKPRHFKLPDRGWKRDGVRAAKWSRHPVQLWLHPAVEWPWPAGDARRLEIEADRGDVSAARILGRTLGAAG